MVKLFRILVIVALALLVVAACLPFSDPAPITISFNELPPLWAIASMAILPVGVALLVAAGGLLAFKRWGRWLGFVVAVASLVIAFLASGSPLAIGLSQ